MNDPGYFGAGREVAARAPDDVASRQPAGDTSPDSTTIAGADPGSPERWTLTLIAGIVRLAEASIIIAAGMLCFALYIGVLRGGFDQWERYAATVFAGTVIALVVFEVASLYTPKRLENGAGTLGRLLAAWGVAFLSVVALGYLLKLSIDFSRGWALLWFVSSAAGLAGLRMGLANWLGSSTGQATLCRRLAIVGAGPISERLLHHLAQPEMAGKFEIVGLFDDRSPDRHGPDGAAGQKIAGTTADLTRLIERARVDVVAIALPWSAATRIREISASLRDLPVDIWLAPDTALFEFQQPELRRIGDLPALEVHSAPLADWRGVLKRAEDLVLGTAILLVAAPFMLLAALAIKLDSRGPVLFRQRRFGFNNQPITVFKFRTMQVEQCDASGAQRTQKNDPRVTRVGRFLRRGSIDELPQLLNVLRGEMSLVGPRAHPIAMKVGDRYYYEAVARYGARHRMKPGITGWAQINGYRGEVDTMEKAERRLELDLHYIDNWSVVFDLWIILRTILGGFTGKAAY
ncbi:MAG: undecaprenyl-phosphate glucose phosphotransferase [Alphaproteobacteria bacterium]|nr:undecaprenyl-phosphate glucose phosphotransferase [Alphaproteobacteria bacterium]